MRMRSARLAMLAAAALVCASALAPAAQAQDFFSALFGGFGGGARGISPISRCRSPMMTVRCPFSGARCGRAMPAVGWRWPGVLRADLRRALLPGRRVRQCKPGGFLQQLLPGERNQGVLRQQHRQRGQPITANPIRSCRTPSAIATNSSAAAPATARTRSVWRRSRSRTTRRCARATSSPATTAFWSRAAAATSAARN